MKEEFTATAKLIIVQKSDAASAQQNYTYSDLQLSQKLANTYSQIIMSEAISDPVRERDLSETRIVIKGEVEDYEFFKKTMNRLFPSGRFTIVHGGEKKGIDVFADQYANELGVKKAVFVPQWKRYKRKAGHVRNAVMLKYAAEKNGYFVTFGPNEALAKQAAKKGVKIINV